MPVASVCASGMFESESSGRRSRTDWVDCHSRGQLPCLAAAKSAVVASLDTLHYCSACPDASAM